MNEIILANAALALLQALLPSIQNAVKAGQITPEEQLKIRANYQAFRDAGDAAFVGPEWEQSTIQPS